jgi:DNA-binding transcriptional regulator YhcF (GntR family)
MNFESSSPIYQQIGDYICNNILRRQFKEGEKIPSVREMAMSVEVNPNTVLRTYNSLQDRDIIHNKRGIGYFVAEDAYERVKQMKTEEFVQNDLPHIFKMIDLLGLTFEDLKSYYDQYKNNTQKEQNR